MHRTLPTARSLLASRLTFFHSQQYYDGTGPIVGRNVSQILSQVVQGLLLDPKRKFSYVEQAYYTKWYETQTAALQAQVQGLVASGQLVFLNGGWSMHVGEEKEILFPSTAAAPL